MFKYTISITLFCSLISIANGCKHTESKTDLVSNRVDANYFNGIEQHRHQLDAYFKGSSTPLDDSLVANFKGINYFPVDTLFRVIARYETISNGNTFKFLATGEIADTYKTIGRLYFTIDSMDCTLDVYENLAVKAKGESIYFIPFWDKTNGEATYSGGRYIDLKPIETESVVLDFNMAYQPYCFYNHAYSCPIPPAVNKLPVYINAGERR